MSAATGTRSTVDPVALASAIIGGAHVSARGTEGRRSVIAQPGSAAEIAELVAAANREGLMVIPVGRETRVPEPTSGDARPRLFIDLGRLNHVIHLDEVSLTARVQAGLTALELEKILAPRGLTIGDLPPSVLGWTIGGMLAVRTPGKMSRRHGTFEEAVLGISAVLADGRTVHTRVAPRRASGPDLLRTICGSEGALGIITSAVLRIHRRPESRLLAAFAAPTFEDALAAVRLALREEAAPAALRALDPDEARAQLDDESQHARPDEAILAVATAGPTDLAACDRDLVASAVEAVGGRPLPSSVAELWWRRRTGREISSDTMAPTLQMTVRPDKQIDVYRAVIDTAAAAGTRARAYASRFDLDGAVMFFTVTDDSGQASEVPPELFDRLQAAAREAGAVLLGASNPVLSPYLESLRTALDPKDTLNPGILDDSPG